MLLPLIGILIKGLHGHRDVRIPIRDGRIVMVGRNGLGKTTVVNIIYLALSQQWNRLLDYNFQELQLSFPNQTVTLRRQHGEKLRANARHMRSVLRHELPNFIFERMSPSDFRVLADVSRGDLPREALFKLSQRLDTPIEILIQVAENSSGRLSPFDEDETKQASTILSAEMNNSQVLYLPTYRRIEKDLKQIVPGLEEQLEAFHRRRSFRDRRSTRTYIELVEFGMEDVERTFRRIRHELTESSREQLNQLAGSYLRDVLRGEGDQYTVADFVDLDQEEIARILGRVEESTLDDKDKTRLQEVIIKLASQAGEGQQLEDKYIAHFFAKLIGVHRALESREKAITQFVSVCNGYLKDKEISFDAKSYSILVRLLNNGEPIELKDLSSGEKQIVSLFSHLYLHEDESFILLIDEPELSLSVPWQKLLLPDIWGSGRVRFLGQGNRTLISLKTSD
jgi:energy-coupling factor transporter ATP-binding protein EcfA2